MVGKSMHLCCGITDTCHTRLGYRLARQSTLDKLLQMKFGKASLVDRVVVANQVLLATMWYITSCWAFVDLMSMRGTEVYRSRHFFQNSLELLLNKIFSSFSSFWRRKVCFL